MQISVDVGGTFTEIVAVDGEGRLVLLNRGPKVPSPERVHLMVRRDRCRAPMEP